MNIADKRPTWTSLIQHLLERADDFMSLPAICAATGANANQAAATLHHLKMHKVVDCLESDGTLFWYANGADDRLKVVEERKVEDGPRRRRKTAKPPVHS